MAGNTTVWFRHVLFHVCDSRRSNILFIIVVALLCYLWILDNEEHSACSTNKLGFTPEFLGRVKLVTSVASLLGVGLYNGFLKKVPLQRIFLVTTCIGSALGMTQVCVFSCFCNHFFVTYLKWTFFFFWECLGFACYWIKPAVGYKWWVVCNWWLADNNGSQSGILPRFWYLIYSLCLSWLLFQDK